MNGSGVIDLVARLRALNTEAVANRGAIAIAVALCAHVAAKIADAHLGETASTRLALDAIDTYLATPALAAGGVASYFGRPSTVKENAR